MLQEARHIVQLQGKTTAWLVQSQSARKRRGYTLPSKMQRELGYDRLVTDMIAASAVHQPTHTLQRVRTRDEMFFRHGLAPLSCNRVFREPIVKESGLNLLAVPATRARRKSSTEADQNTSNPTVPPMLGNVYGQAATAIHVSTYTSSSSDVTSDEEEPEHENNMGTPAEISQDTVTALQAISGGFSEQPEARHSPVLQRKQSVEYTASLYHLTRRNSRSVVAVGISEEDHSTPAYVQAMIKPQVTAGMMSRRFSMVERGSLMPKTDNNLHSLSRSTSLDSFQAGGVHPAASQQWPSQAETLAEAQQVHNTPVGTASLDHNADLKLFPISEGAMETSPPMPAATPRRPTRRHRPRSRDAPALPVPGSV
jgi:hypothetical protein